MKKIGLGLLTALIMMLGVNTAWAQDTISPEKSALIKELIEVTGVRQNFNSTISNILSFQRQTAKDMLEQLADDKSGTTGGKEKFAEIVDESVERAMARVQKFFDEKFDFDKFVDDVYVPVFSKHFTEQELREMIAYYRTPTGQKSRTEMPGVMQDSMAAISKSFMPGFMEFMKQTVDEEKAALIQKLPKKKAVRRT
jgi:uncharacterized protein